MSDIHAYSESRLEAGESAPSWVEISNPSSVVGRNPFLALKELIDRNGLRADVLVNCGDLGDKAQPDAIAYAWRETREVADALGVAKIVATAGNHDVDSRGVFTSHDARGTLLSLPDFPFNDGLLNNEYWARSVVVVEDDTTRWVVLNSAAYHGFKDEYRHGRIAASTIEYLKKRLDETSNTKLNILVCHHHIYKISNIDLSDYSEMTDGSALLNLLENGGYGSWIVLHGHRHWPSITYAPGGNNSPVVFASGSLSAVLWDEVADKARNQFYIIELDTSPNLGRVRGTFTAWDFVSDEGFSPAQERSGLPHKGGFGGTMSGPAIAGEIVKLFGDPGPRFIPWDEVEGAVPELRFTLPKDMKQCVDHLKNDHGISVLTADGEPQQVGRPK